RKKLVEVSAGLRDAVIENSLALHPSIVVALVDNIDLFDIAHADVRSEHRAVGEVPRQPVRVPEAISVDFAERLRIAVRCELVDRGNRVIAESFHPSRYRRTARIDPKYGGNDRIEALCLARIRGVRSSAVAESEIASARVKEA